MDVVLRKRMNFWDEDLLGSKSRKTQKLHNVQSTNGPEIINSAHSLKQLLSFRQDNISGQRQNIQDFKTFLEAILYGDDEEDGLKKSAILLEYLESTVPKNDDKSLTAVPDVIQTWSFAVQSNHDGLLSAVPAVLALLLKTISTSVAFRACGAQLCKTLLQKEQIKLFDRGLTANKTKEYLISPCLRLLTEIVSFDGGISARGVHTQRHVTFKRLDIFLGMRSHSGKSNKVGRRKPSVRNNALRFLLSNLRVQDHATKAEILSQPRLIRAVFQDLLEDSSEVIRELLESVKEAVILDNTITRRHKSRLFTDWTLNQILRLYEYNDEGEAKEGQSSVSELTHEFLLLVCTTQDLGVLVEQQGWYPPALRATEQELREHEPSFPSSQSKDHVTVRNTTLASVLQGLRPYASVYHRKLTLAVFSAAPELIADYFFKRKIFPFEPKLSATWIGYASFLFGVVELPPPSTLYEYPPPVTIVLESILPQPMSQKTLARCLNQHTYLITFFATRLMLLAFNKLEAVVQSWSLRQDNKWTYAAKGLIAGFCRRCPELRHVIHAFRTVHEEQVMLREALLRLIALYYRVTPQLALNEKFEVSALLSGALQINGAQKQHLEESKLHDLELNHLLAIAQRSPDIAWWHRPDKMLLSPFTTILKLGISTQGTVADDINVLLRSIIKDYAVLQQETRFSSFAALNASLSSTDGWEASSALYEFLDNCILRFVRKSIKYAGDKDAWEEQHPPINPVGTMRRPISLLFFVLLEQWPFFASENSNPNLDNVSSWLARYLDMSCEIGEDIGTLRRIRDQLLQEVKELKCGASIKNALTGISDRNLSIKTQILVISDRTCKDVAAAGTNNTIHQEQLALAPASSFYASVPEEDENHQGLNRYNMDDVEVAVAEGAVGDLLLCLCSKHTEIRRQALLNIRILIAKIEASGYSEWQQLVLLLQEIMESAKKIIPDTPFPYFAGVLAAKCVMVLNDPLHFMYSKVNKFLNKGPEWNIERLPSYWIGKVLLSPPTEDDAHHRELAWVLEVFMDGLRSTMDMELFRRHGVFERLLSLTTSPSRTKACNEKIMQILYRCSQVGGSTTLITRCGVLGWIQAQEALKGPHHVTLEQLAAELHQTCDFDHVQEWSDGTLVRKVANNNI